MKRLALALLLLPAAARGADDEAPAADEALDDRVRVLEDRVHQLERMLVERQPRVVHTGYVDAGFFATQGDGTGFVRDAGPAAMRAFPAYTDRYAWVFLGDLLSTAVNTRGEAADLGNPAGIDRFDGIASRGAPGFILNEVNLTVAGTLTESALATASVDFVPRSGLDFRSGDTLDVDIAQLEWMIGRARHTSLFVGKVGSVLGIEYRERKSNRRFGITPSLIARYTTGTALGVKVRSKLGPAERIVVAAAVTNGSWGWERFHFYDEIDSNAGKTGSARLAVLPPLPGDATLEIGASGEYGPQDHALDSAGALWFVGADLRLAVGGLVLKAEWLTGRGDGERGMAGVDPHRPWGLRLRAGSYLEADWMLTPWLGVLARAEQRNADVWLGDPGAPGGADRLYLSRSWRATAGVRASFGPRVALKAEYLRNGEYGGVPAIRNDVFTTSLVLAY